MVFYISSETLDWLKRDGSRNASLIVPSVDQTTASPFPAPDRSFADIVYIDGPSNFYRFEGPDPLTDIMHRGDPTYAAALHGTAVLGKVGSFYGSEGGLSESVGTYDGGNGYVDLGAGAINASCSIEAVFCWTGGTAAVLRDASSLAAGWILAKPIGSNLGYRIGGTDYTTSALISAVRQGGTSPNSDDPTLWNHVIVTKQSAAVKYYLNGTLVHSATNAPTNTASAGVWYVGKDGLDASYSSVCMDELAFYTYALSAQQVAAHYASWAGLTS